MPIFIKNWKKTVVFGAVYAAVSSVIMTFLSMPFNQIISSVVVSTIIVMLLVNYVGVFKSRD